MTKNECPLGEDCDLMIAYRHGLSSAKDIIIQNGELEAERDEARMQSLADLGQAQDAYEALKKAEAERDKLREALERIKSGSEYYADLPMWVDRDTAKYAYESTFRLAVAALGETEK